MINIGLNPEYLPPKYVPVRFGDRVIRDAYVRIVPNAYPMTTGPACQS